VIYADGIVISGGLGILVLVLVVLAIVYLAKRI
jgi:hypothetical protein